MTEAETWNRLSSWYDVIVGLFDSSYPRVRELLRADLAGRAHVLEVAAGTGQFTFDLAETAERVTASDSSSEMVRRLQDKVDERRVRNVTTAVMSAYALEFEDGALDGIFCANALHVMETPRVALSEFRRVLRPGGRLVLPTFCHGVGLRRRVLSRLLSLVGPFVAFTRFTPASLQEMVAGAGFEVKQPIVLPGKFPLAYVVADVPLSR